MDDWSWVNQFISAGCLSISIAELIILFEEFIMILVKSEIYPS